MGEEIEKCRYASKCGGCRWQGLTYEAQLDRKEAEVRRHLRDICRVREITPASDPWHYRNKVHAVVSRTKGGRVVTGIYTEGTHRVVPVQSCLIEDERADAVIATLRRLIESFHIRVYDEDTGEGFLRHILIRVGRRSGQMLVVLVGATPIFPSKKNFIRALLAEHPDVTSVVLNVNPNRTSMVLGKRNIVLYGKGFIEDTLCGKIFRISPGSFYQINTEQTERLYGKAVGLADLTGRERVIDAYCGIGTIGLSISDHVSFVTGVELNRDAVRDAVSNAKRNHAQHIQFVSQDATRFLTEAAARGEKADVLFMDPPRAGSTPDFIRASASMRPARIVYISCNPETLARDLRIFAKRGYRAEEVWPFDMFPWTSSIEAVTVLTYRGGEKSEQARRKKQKQQKG